MEYSKCSKWRRYRVKCLSVSEKLAFIIWSRDSSTQKTYSLSILFSNSTINKPISIFYFLSSGNITNQDTRSCLKCPSGGKGRESEWSKSFHMKHAVRYKAQGATLWIFSSDEKYLQDWGFLVFVLAFMALRQRNMQNKNAKKDLKP